MKIKHKKKKQNYKRRRNTKDNIFLALMFILDIFILILCYLFCANYVGEIFIAIQFLLLFICTVIFYNKKSGRKFLSYEFNKLNTLTGEEFERLLKIHFTRMGFRVSLTPKSGDFGADLILKRNGEKIIVQAKRYSNSVGIAAVQEAIGAKEYYNGDRAMVVTNSYYTPAAIELARKANVTLWDRKEVSQIVDHKKYPKI